MLLLFVAILLFTFYNVKRVRATQPFLNQNPTCVFSDMSLALLPSSGQPMKNCALDENYTKNNKVLLQYKEMVNATNASPNEIGIVLDYADGVYFIAFHNKIAILPFEKLTSHDERLFITDFITGSLIKCSLNYAQFEVAGYKRCLSPPDCSVVDVTESRIFMRCDISIQGKEFVNPTLGRIHDVHRLFTNCSAQNFIGIVYEDRCRVTNARRMMLDKIVSWYPYDRQKVSSEERNLETISTAETSQAFASRRIELNTVKNVTVVNTDDKRMQEGDTQVVYGFCGRTSYPYDVTINECEYDMIISEHLRGERDFVGHWVEIVLSKKNKKMIKAEIIEAIYTCGPPKFPYSSRRKGGELYEIFVLASYEGKTDFHGRPVLFCKEIGNILDKDNTMLRADRLELGDYNVWVTRYIHASYKWKIARGEIPSPVTKVDANQSIIEFGCEGEYTDSENSDGESEKVVDSNIIVSQRDGTDKDNSAKESSDHNSNDASVTYWKCLVSKALNHPEVRKTLEVVNPHLFNAVTKKIGLEDEL